MHTDTISAIMGEVKKVVVGKDDCVEKMMITFLAGGHILIEDIPGVGKTTLAMAFSKAMDLEQRRIQFTPDVLPADIVGFHMYQGEKLVYQPGAVLCNLFLADEINRTSPKTQSALLEVMEEGKVTVDGRTRQVPQPFIVVATQNPMGSAGTQPLPDSQLDRFMISMTMGYPDIAQEINIVKDRNGGNPMDQVRALASQDDLLEMKQKAESIFVHDAIYNYLADLIVATREHPDLELGVSPRGTLALTRMAKSTAFLRGRSYTIPEDVKYIFPDVVKHRIRLNARAKVNHQTPQDVIKEILEKVKAPTPKKKN